MNQSFQSPGFWYDGIAIVRIMVGGILISHGWQLFEIQSMDGFTGLLLNMSLPFQEAMSYTGKVVELAGGLLLILGLFTRLMSALLFLNYGFITFIMGTGKIFTADQHPFLLALFSLLFFFAGAGRVSIDYILFINRKEDKHGSGLAVHKKFGRYVSRS